MFLWMLLQQPLNKFDGVLAYHDWIVNFADIHLYWLPSYRFLHVKPLVLSIEGLLASQHFVGEHAQAPKVEGLAMLVMYDAAVSAIVAVVVPVWRVFLCTMCPPKPTEFGDAIA